MKAIATLLYSPEYLPGAVVLGHVLRQFKLVDTKLVVLIDSARFDALQLLALRQLWDVLEDTQVLESHLTAKLTADLKRPELAQTFTKIQLWKLPYETVLYLDADTLPIVGTNNVTDLLQLDFPADKIVAAPDSGFPDIFNSGVFVLHPNEDDYLNLLQLVLSNDENISFDGADQGLLNQYFNAEPDWVVQHLKSRSGPLTATSRDSNWVQIPFLYNTTPNAQYEYYPAANHFSGPSIPSSTLNANPGADSTSNSGGEIYVKNVISPYYTVSPYGNVGFDHFSGADSRIKVIHYIGPVKPWKVQPTGIFEKWWSSWYEYSGGKLLHDAIYGSKAGKKLLGKVTPSDLCNPENYQQFATNVSSVHSWDATKEDPPNQTPKVTNFDTEVRSFRNLWGEKPPAKTKQISSSLFGQKNSHLDGVHDQIPERVFDDDHDYVPEHLLMMRDEEYNEVVEEEHLDEEEDHEFEEIENSKVFPWEYRDNVPSRSW